MHLPTKIKPQIQIVFISRIDASGYRSLRSIRFPVDRLSVFVGENGSGKTNLYRSLQLIQAAASGTLALELATEGGMASAVWAGERSKGEKARISLRVTFNDEEFGAPCYEYGFQVGFVPPPPRQAFPLEPQIREESLIDLYRRRPLTLLDRRNAYIAAVDGDGAKHEGGMDILPTETALAALQDPRRYPAFHEVRSTMKAWRFYHDFRTDQNSALRAPALPITTPTLASDGNNLAAVFATLRYINQDTAELDAAIDDAFPGACLIAPFPGDVATFGLKYPEYPHRVFNAVELSDGTLRYLALAGALNAPRLPPFIALNEPESSLHPRLLPALARMIQRAADKTQVWLVTHSSVLADELARAANIAPITVYKEEGETWLKGLNILGNFKGATS